MDQKVSIADFDRMFRVDDELQLVGLTVQQQSVWLAIFDDCITESERRKRLDEISGTIPFEEFSVITEHPTSDPTSPVLSLPCSKEEFRNFVRWAKKAGCINKDECHDEVKKIISCPETADKIVEEGRREDLSEKEIAQKVDECFYEEKRFSDMKLGKLLAGGLHMAPSGYVTRARRARGLKK